MVYPPLQVMVSILVNQRRLWLMDVLAFSAGCGGNTGGSSAQRVTRSAVSPESNELKSQAPAIRGENFSMKTLHQLSDIWMIWVPQISSSIQGECVSSRRFNGCAALQQLKKKRPDSSSITSGMLVTSLSANYTFYGYEEPSLPS